MNKISKPENTIIDKHTICNALFNPNFSEDDLVEIKKDEIATDLICLMNQANLKRSDLSQFLGLPKSRVTKILSGRENLTIKTIFLFAHRLGFDFDVIFRHHSEKRNSQPWHANKSTNEAANFLHENFTPKSRQQIFSEIQNGKGSLFYLSFKNSHYAPEEIHIADASNNKSAEEKSYPVQIKNDAAHLVLPLKTWFSNTENVSR